MNSARVNPNISYASIVSGAFKTKDLSLLPSENYTFKSPLKQYFSFPFDLMKYILKNPKSSNVLLKLYKTCKYFYSKKQVLIVSGKFTPAERWPFFSFYEIENKNNFKSIKTPYLWFENDLFLNNEYFFNLDKIYRCTAKDVLINIKLTYKEFKLLVAEGTVESFIFGVSAKIKSSDTEETTIADILELLPNIKKFWYVNAREEYSKEILKKMNSINLNTKLEEICFQIIKVSENFDATLLFQFILENAAQFCQINLLPFGENEETILSKLKAAEEKFKSLKEWNNKNFSLSFVLQ